MIRSISEVIVTIVMIGLVVFIVYIGVEKGIEKENRYRTLETRIDRLEDRVGGLCVEAYGKSTGFDRAIVGD